MPSSTGCDEADEAKLIESAVSGDPKSFAILFNNYYPMIYAFAYRLSLSGPDAQDIAQETFIKAARSLVLFRGESSFKNWLYQIAVNGSRDWRRRSMREATATEEMAAGLRGEEWPADFGEVHDALGTLADELRQAIVLVYYEGVNHAQAARICGCAETTISWRLFMAKRKLKKLLQNHKR